MILSCGEALIDMLPVETPAGETGFVPHAGGGAFNTAIALGRLGAPVGFYAGISSDLFGERLIAALGDANVETRYAAVSDQPTTLAFVQLQDGHATYSFFDENSAGRMLSPDTLPVPLDHGNALFFGGISLIAEPCGSTYEALMVRDAEKCVTMLDPNIRTGFIRDEGAYRDRLARMIALADIVKVSDEDLTWLEGAFDLDVAARQLRAKGPKIVVVTRGADGADVYTSGDQISVPSEPVRVADTVGAGDTFNAGILAYLQEHDLMSKAALADIQASDLAGALRFASEVAAITVSRAGANPPWRSEIHGA